MHALSHVTGGGLAANLARVIPSHLSARLDRGSWRPAPIFALVGAVGGVARNELERTLNMGVGMVAVVAPDDVDRGLELLAERGANAWVLGEIVDGDGTVSLYGEHSVTG